MKTVKFNEEEIELLVALYEDELKEAGSYIDKLQQTLSKLKKQAESAKAEPTRIGKKRGRKPKKQLQAPKPATGGKKRGRKPRVQEAPKPEVVKVVVKKAAKKKKVRKPKKQVVLKPKAVKLPKVEKTITEEVKPL